jgi:hypothetical protein
MSQENVETYERGVAGINGRAFSDELFTEICTPDFRMENTSTAVTDKTYHGAQGVREWITTSLRPSATRRATRTRRSSPTPMTSLSPSSVSSDRVPAPRTTRTAMGGRDVVSGSQDEPRGGLSQPQ